MAPREARSAGSARRVASNAVWTLMRYIRSQDAHPPSPTVSQTKPPATLTRPLRGVDAAVGDPVNWASSDAVATG